MMPRLTILLFLALANAALTDQNLYIGFPVGSVESVTFYWSTDAWGDTLKIKFFRRIGDTLTMIAERGPYSVLPEVVVSGSNSVGLVPEVAVQQGDLIGVTRLSGCGTSPEVSISPRVDRR
jgi:hypothetical protein